MDHLKFYKEVMEFFKSNVFGPIVEVILISSHFQREKIFNLNKDNKE